VGVLEIAVGLDTEKVLRALRLIQGELRRLRKAPPSFAECRRARDYLIGQFDLGLEGTENQMMWLAEQMLGYGRTVPPERIKRRLAQVSASQIRAAAQEYLRPEKMSLALVSPLKSEKGLLPLLVSRCAGA
jgi:predicted Zn-dependent peptidase